jgi:hypothetical protein
MCFFQRGFIDVCSVVGGIDAWSLNVDPAILSAAGDDLRSRRRCNDRQSAADRFLRDATIQVVVFDDLDDIRLFIDQQV